MGAEAKKNAKGEKEQSKQENNTEMTIEVKDEIRSSSRAHLQMSMESPNYYLSLLVIGDRTSL